VTNGFSPAFYWDTGFPKTSITLPPTIDPSIGIGSGPTWITSNRNVLPRYQNYSLSLEREVGNSWLLRAFYSGNHGTRLPSNAASLGVLDNMNNPSVLALGPTLLGSGCDGTTCPGGVPIPYGGFTGDVAQALRPWPQYTNLNILSVPFGYSTYNSFTAEAEKRFTGGLIARIAYTNSKLINSGAEDVLAGEDPGIQNPLNGSKDDRALSRDDIPQSLILAWSYELPFGKGKRFSASGPLDKIVGGWTIAATQRYDSGRPLSITMACDFCGFIFSNEKRPNRVPGARAYGVTSGIRPCVTGVPCQTWMLKSAWSDPGPLTFGNEPQTDPHVRGPHYFNEDFSIHKMIPFTERVSALFETNIGNVFNRHLWCNPDTNWSDPNFGQVSGQCDTPRSIQFGLRVEF
jgi:hypothetical protein